jgi:membrane-associated phospholipid phosphatase
MLKNKEKRTIPYIIMIVVYAFMLFFFIKFYISTLVLRFLIGLIIGLTSLTIINSYYKSSLHGFAMGSLLAFFIRLYFIEPGMIFYPLIIVITISGLIGSSRLALEAHTKGELIAGYSIGITTVITALLV